MSLKEPKRWILNRAKQRAGKRNQEFSITIADIPDTPEFCPVFPWVKLVRCTGKGRGLRNDSPSLDRIDSSKGYVPGNLRIICWRANVLKRDGTSKEMQYIVDDLKKYGF